MRRQHAPTIRLSAWRVRCVERGHSRRPIRHVPSRLERQTRARQDTPDRTPDLTRLGAFPHRGKGARRMQRHHAPPIRLSAWRVRCVERGNSRRPIRHVQSRLERQTRARQDTPDRTPDLTRLGAFPHRGKGARRMQRHHAPPIRLSAWRVRCVERGHSRRPIRHVQSRLERQTRARQDTPDRTPDVTRLGAFPHRGKGARRMQRHHAPPIRPPSCRSTSRPGLSWARPPPPRSGYMRRAGRRARTDGRCCPLSFPPDEPLRRRTSGGRSGAFPRARVCLSKLGERPRNGRLVAGACLPSKLGERARNGRLVAGA
jgi:hypothetical protein